MQALHHNMDRRVQELLSGFRVEVFQQDPNPDFLEALSRGLCAAAEMANISISREDNLHKRFQQYEHAHQACERAMTRYDQLDLLLHLLRQTLHFCSPFGRFHTVEGVRSELTLLPSLIQEIDDAMLPSLLRPPDDRDRDVCPI